MKNIGKIYSPSGKFAERAKWTTQVKMEMWNNILAIKQQIFMVKTSNFTTKCNIDCWVIALKRQKSK